MPQTPENEATKTPMQVLEEALEHGKFGYFNYKLMLATFMAVFSYTSVTTTSSYILSSAECDLNMSIMEKGMLNAMPFFGQVAAAPFTGFITDAFGRKLFLVWGHAGILACALLEGTSQNYWMLLLGKLLDGIFLSFTYSATAVMVTECTHKGVRDRVLLVYSSFMSLSLILCALVAWGMLMTPWHFVIIKGYLEFHPWNIYLYSTGITSLIAMLLYIHLPESPKFLLTLGKESKALEVIKRIYHENSRQSKDTFPIKSFNASGVHFTPEKISIKKKMSNALFQSKELFKKPLVFILLLFGSSYFVNLLAYSALRLWFPQISTIIENYQYRHGGDTDRFCVMIDGYTSELAKNVSLAAATNSVTDICVPHPAGPDTYINGMILGVQSLAFILISTALVDHIGQKPLMFVVFVACATCSAALYWTSSPLSIGLLIAGTCALMQCALSIQNTVLMRVVPTSVRALALTLNIMLGRVGSLVGSVLFPVMLQRGCMFPFMTLSIITLCVAGMVYFYPNPKKENAAAGDK
ncbi:synaptic vesicle glycoprotein 2B-like isoform X2 [Leguminivora glycinivorella]|uniref:synaptic vesicle glycoprotein 2B-like isoform X2 n=1 Tax=Leguminivora glycinivorella TaxID=1035111 RepID=UPI00200BAE12|nr:synaptic vesicle glycoprotein 2B-like isoform X2 [Leguminivora glycinivorella]